MKEIDIKRIILRVFFPKKYNDLVIFEWYESLLNERLQRAWEESVPVNKIILPKKVEPILFTNFFPEREFKKGSIDVYESPFCTVELKFKEDSLT